MPLEQKPFIEEKDSSPAKKRKLSDNESPVQKSKIQKSSSNLEKLSSGEDVMNTSSGSETENCPSFHNTLEGMPKQSNTISKYLKENCKAVVLLQPLNSDNYLKKLQDNQKTACASKSSDVIDLTSGDSQPSFAKIVENESLSNDESEMEDMDVTIEEETNGVKEDANLSSTPCNGSEEEANCDSLAKSSPTEERENSDSLENTPVSSDNLSIACDSVSPSPEENCNKTPKIKREANKVNFTNINL